MPLLGSLEQWTLLSKESLRFRMQQQKLPKLKNKEKQNEEKSHTPEYLRTVPQCQKLQHPHNGDIRRKGGGEEAVLETMMTQFSKINTRPRITDPGSSETKQNNCQKLHL